MGVPPAILTGGFFGPSFLLMAVLPSSRSGLTALPGVPFPSLLLCLQTLFFGGHGCVRDDADTRWESLFLTFFLTLLNAQVHIVWVSPLLLIRPSPLPEPALVVTFAIHQMLSEMGVHVGADFFDLRLAALQIVLVDKGKPLHAAQERD